jgi:NADH:ubiquinone oxidoreductase subunit F (NADH-binding)
VPGAGPALIAEVDRAGLRGRGGGGFPTAVKLRTVARAGRAVVVANGTEGEPASTKDSALLVGSPHLVLDGASIAADLVGSRDAIICVDRGDTPAASAVQTAIAERGRAGADRVSFRLETAPSKYVAGEESALVHWIGRGDARPTFVPPRPYERGVGGRPTLVNNVETLAHLALIARFGADWFRGLGTSDDPGTALVTLTGDVPGPGVYELPFGLPFVEVLRAAGWGGTTPQAVLIGGYAGTWVDGRAAVAVSMDTPSLRRAGASLGCGAVSVLGPDRCGLFEVARVTRWMAGQSAGQCGPCWHGLPAIATAVEGLCAGDRNRRWEAQLGRWLDMVDGRGACHHPDGVVRFVRSALAVFAGEISQHRHRGPCRPRQALLPTPQLSEGWT